MLAADYHVHSNYSMDSDERMSESIRRGIEIGLKEIMFTDHYEVFSAGDCLGNVINYTQYCEEIQEHRERNARQIKIGLGAEINLEPDVLAQYKNQMQRYPFDFIIGSLHNIHFMDIALPSFSRGRTVDEYHSQYFEAMLQRVEMDFPYSVIGHLDYVARYGGYSEKRVNLARQRKYIEPILRMVIESGKGIELNTSGLRYGLGAMHPNLEMLKLYRELGGEIITVGSDSHYARTVGQDFDKAKFVLQEAGFRYYTTFERLKPIFHKI